MPRKPIVGQDPTFAAVLNAIDEMVLVKGDRSQLLWANRAFQDYYGMSNDELAELIDAPHSDPDDTVQYVRDDHQVYSSGQPLSIVEPVTDAHGTVAYFHTVKTAIKDEHGDVYATVGVSRRNHDQEAALELDKTRSIRKASNEALRSLVGNLPIAVAMLDVSQRFLCHSPAWTELFGPPPIPEEDQFYDAWLGDRLPMFEDLQQVVLDRNPRQIKAVAIQSITGSSIVADVEIHPWFFATQELGGSIVLIRDITDLMRSERALAQRNDELIQFNYRVSHDLISPLRTIRGYLEICQAEMTNDPALVDDLQKKMIDRVDHLSTLIQDILKLAQSDLLDEHTEEVDMASAIEQLIESHNDELDQCGITVHTELAAPPLPASRIRFMQIFENLLSNAIKFHDPEEQAPTITISSRVEDDKLVVDFTDNGLGFSEEVVRSAFEIFVRGGSQQPGSGLGLYLIDKHVQQMNGEIIISSPAKPTTFTLSLPATEGLRP